MTIWITPFFMNATIPIVSPALDHREVHHVLREDDDDRQAAEEGDLQQPDLERATGGSGSKSRPAMIADRKKSRGDQCPGERAVRRPVGQVPGEQDGVGDRQQQRRGGEPVPPQGAGLADDAGDRRSRRAPRRSRPDASRWPSRPAARRGPSPSWARARSRRRRPAHRRFVDSGMDGLSLSLIGGRVGVSGGFSREFRRP